MNESTTLQETIETFKNISKQITEVSENTSQIAELIESQTVDFNSIDQEMDATSYHLQEGASKSQMHSEQVLENIRHIFKETNQIHELSNAIFVTATNMSNIVNGFTLIE